MRLVLALSLVPVVVGQNGYRPVAEFDPSARVAVSGNKLYIKTDSPREDPRRCDYVVTAVFTDGTSLTRNGTTDPPIASTNFTSVTLVFDKTVSSGELNRWVCRFKN